MNPLLRLGSLVIKIDNDRNTCFNDNEPSSRDPKKKSQVQDADLLVDGVVEDVEAGLELQTVGMMSARAPLIQEDTKKRDRSGH